MQGNIVKNHKRKIGIMGGTFNPIHIGHLIIAEMAFEQFQLDKVLFMPTCQPPHKIGECIEEDVKRVAMVKLAIYDNPHFELSLLEVNRKGISYTAQTLDQLTSEYPDTEFYFIVGGDSVAAIEKWREPEKVLKLSHLVACVRDQVDDEKLQEQIQYLNTKYHTQVFKLNVPKMDISSTMIRERIKSQLSVKYLLPDNVFSYIEQYGLYKDII